MIENMRSDAEKFLNGRLPDDIAQKAGVLFDKEKNIFIVPSLKYEITVSWPDLTVKGTADPWHELAVLHYLSLADGTPLYNEWVSFGAIKDGLIRGTGLDRSSSQELGKLFAYKDEAQIKSMCIEAGGEEIKTKADFSVVFNFLPRYPVLLNVWFADEEFPLSARFLADKSADRYLTIEDATTVLPLITAEIEKSVPY